MAKPKCLYVTGLTRKKYVKLLKKCNDKNWEFFAPSICDKKGRYTFIASRRSDDGYRIMEREIKKLEGEGTKGVLRA